MSEEHPFFRLLCFHRNLVRFVFHCSATSRDLDTHRYSKPSTIRLVSFMWLLEHVRTRSAACGAITRSSWILTTRWRTVYITQPTTCFRRAADAKIRPLHPFIAAFHLPSLWMLTQCDSLSPHYQQCDSPPTNSLWRVQYHGLRVTIYSTYVIGGVVRSKYGRWVTIVPPSGVHHYLSHCSNTMHYMIILKRLL